MKNHATDDGMEKGQHLMKNGEISISSKHCAELSHATNDGMEKGLYLMKNGKMSMSMKSQGHTGISPGMVECTKKGDESMLGISSIKDLYLSIVEMKDAGSSEPILVTAQTMNASYLCAIGAYTQSESAESAVKRAYSEMKNRWITHQNLQVLIFCRNSM